MGGVIAGQNITAGYVGGVRVGRVYMGEVLLADYATPAFVLNEFPGATYAAAPCVLSSLFLDEWLMQVRRSSDDDEAQVLGDPAAGYVITLNSPIVGSSATFGDFVGVADGLVSAAREQGGTNNNATQGTKTAQPRLVNAGVLEVDGDGKCALRFDGTDDRLTIPNEVVTEHASLFVAVRHTPSLIPAPAVGAMVFSIRSTVGGNAGRVYMLIGSGNSHYVIVGSGATNANGAASVGTAATTEIYAATAGSTRRIDGVETAEANLPGSLQSAPLLFDCNIGSDYSGTTTFYQGHIRFIGLWSSKQSTLHGHV